MLLMTEDDRQFNPAVNCPHISPRFCMPVRYLAHPQSEWIDDQYSAIAAECGVSRQLLCARYTDFSSSAFRRERLFDEPKIAFRVASEKAHTSPAHAQSKCSSKISNPQGTSQIIVTEYCCCLLVKRCRPQCLIILLKYTFHAGGNDCDSLGSRL